MKQGRIIFGDNDPRSASWSFLKPGKIKGKYGKWFTQNETVNQINRIELYVFIYSINIINHKL